MSVEINPKQALKLLMKSKNPLVIRARYEAIELCKKKGTTHTREVREVMAFKGVLQEVADDRWMGSIFTAEFFEDTGETVPVSDEERNIHKGRDVKLWRLKEIYKDIQLPEPTDLPAVEKKVRLNRMDQLVREVQMRIGEEGLLIRVAGLMDKDQPLEGEGLVSIQYRRRYADGMSGLRTVTAESLERALNKVVETEDENDKKGVTA